MPRSDGGVRAKRAAERLGSVHGRGDLCRTQTSGGGEAWAELLTSVSTSSYGVGEGKWLLELD